MADMRRFSKIFALVLCLLTVASCGAAFAVEQTKEMKRMSVFLSNFTEAGLFNFDLKDGDDDEDETFNEYEEAKIHLGNPNNVTELIRFGIVHNLINNYKSRIRRCSDPDCESGSLTVDKKFVFESVKKYFGLDISQRDMSVIEENQSVVFSYDGKLFHFDADSFKEPDNDTVYYADVLGVIRKGKNLSLAGDIYNSKRKTDRPGMFAATVRPVGDTWVIIDMTTDWVTNAGRD
ncbi:MAG: hypothetical protein IJP91_06770 [Synergistaceae bacterium]|nr:hypothetical protein [Synergistaceae bacterium]